MTALVQAAWHALALLCGITALFLLLRNQATSVASSDQVVGSGQPTVVEIYSNL